MTLSSIMGGILMAPIPLMSYSVSSLTLFGIGWAFMFNGGTFMLNAFSHSAHKARLQGIHSLVISLPNALASLSAGSMMAFTSGWPQVNMLSVVILLATILLLIFIRTK